MTESVKLTAAQIAENSFAIAQEIENTGRVELVKTKDGLKAFQYKRKEIKMNISTSA